MSGATGTVGQCSRCGASLKDTTPDALCVRCLLSNALLTSPEQPELETEELLAPEKLLQRKKFAGYELLGEIARGGMGVVFRARQVKLNRTVALKVIAAGELASPRMVERFRTEAESAARLEHPNIVPILEVGHQDGWHFFSMRLIEGGTLGDRLKAKPFTPEEAAKLLIKIARAVHHAHQHGVLHRDLKPTNILLDTQGEPHLTDFGLAKTSEEGRELTRSMAVLGTPAYMSPEQALGQTRDVTVGADVYGLGAVLYELLTGHPPFSAGSTPALLRQIIEDDVPAFGKDSAADHDLEVICLKCLEKEPAHRYASAMELAEDLERWLRGEPIIARSSTAWERGVKWTRRHPAKAALAMLVPLLLLIISIGSLWFNVQLSQSRRALQNNALATRRELLAQHFHEASLLAAAYDGYGAMLPLVEAMQLEQEDTGRTVESLERLSLTSQFSPQLMRLWDARGTPVTLSFSADNARLTAIMRNGGERVWQLDTGREISASESGPNPTRGPEALVGSISSADGRWQAVANGRSAQITNKRSGEKLFEVRPNNVFLDQNFSPDGRFYATASFADQAEVRTMPEGNRYRSVMRHNNGANRVLYSPDSRLLATAGFDYQVRLHYANELRQALPTIQHGALVEALAFSPDGRYLATGDAWGSVRVFDLYLRRLFVPTGAISARKPDISPDGKLAVLVRDGKQVQLWDIATQKESRKTFTSSGAVAQTTFDREGRQLAIASGRQGVQVWDIKQDRVTLDLPDVGRVATVAFNPEGTKLLVALDNFTAQVWDIPEKKAIGPVLDRKTYADGRPLSAQWTNGIKGSVSSWSPDGKWLVVAGGINYVTVWEAATGKAVGEPLFGPGEARAIHFSLDHQRLVIAFNDRNIEPAFAQMYELPSLRPMGPPLMHGDGVSGAQFAENGEVLVTSGQDSVVRLWRVADGRPASPEFRHGGVVSAQNFRPKRAVLATSADDRSVRLWDTGRGELLAPPLVLGYAPQTINFTPDGETMLFGSARGPSYWVNFKTMNWGLDSWRRLAMCLNGVKLNEQGLRIMIMPQELAKTFAELQAAQPEDFQWPKDSAAWHKHTAAVAELQGDWFTAAFHLRKLQAAFPADEQIQARLAAAQEKVK
jgi:WD40 repeat protein/tRNA A-37 threonylcarbamoyl transferase component Bud32